MIFKYVKIENKILNNLFLLRKYRTLLISEIIRKNTVAATQWYFVYTYAIIQAYPLMSCRSP